MGPNRVVGFKELTGPPVDIEATLSANLDDVRSLLNNIQEYVDDVQKISKEQDELNKKAQGDAQEAYTG
jgi:hypothetical protein